MSLKGVQVTNRKLKNKDTGIDLFVPSYEDAESPKMVQNYHVIVITRLSYFKSGEHSPDDVVQFMVPRKYEDFEALQNNLLRNHPDFSLPALPKRSVWFLDENDLEERRLSFHCLLVKLSKHPYYAKCPPLLDFLGVNTLADRNYFKAREKFLEQKKKAAAPNEKETADPFAVTQAEDDNVSPTGTPQNSLFDASTTRKPAAYQPLIDPILTETDNTNLELEDNSELLGVEESLDDVLRLSKKPSSGNKVLFASNKNQHSSPSQLIDEKEINVEQMDDTDIMKYIKQEEGDSDNVDLFS